MNTPLLIAHRGDTENFPENTIEAFASALDKGADGIEFDVHLNAQGVPIVVHNYLFDQGSPYPLLEEVLELFAQRAHIELEIKSLEENAVERVAQVVERYRPLQIEVTSSVQPLLPRIAKWFPDDRRGVIFRKWLIEDWMPSEFRVYWIIRHMELLQATVLHLDKDLYFPELIEALHQCNMRAHAHLPIVTDETLTAVRALGIDQCTFDRNELWQTSNT